MPELRVAVVGTGQMGTHHVNALERIETVELVAVADPVEDAARAAIGRRPVEWVADWRAIVERGDIDAVSIVAPSEMHAEITIAALESGKHVLVEKPIATTVADGRRMADTARRAGRKLMVGHVERFNPAVEKVAALLRENRVGRVYRASATRSGPIPPRIKDTGVGIDLATHDVDVMQHVLDTTVTQVYAERAQFQHASQEDMLTCLLRFGGDGPFGLLDVNWLTPEKRRELSILGEAGLLRADYLSQDVWFSESATTLTGWDELARLRGDAEGAVLRFALRKQEPLVAELEAFALCILNDTPEPVTAEEGTQVLAVAVALQVSSLRGVPVVLPDERLEPVVAG